MSIKLRALAGISALAAISAMAATAQAETIVGGGSSLIAPYARQAGNCFGDDVVSLPSRTGSSTDATTITYSNFPGGCTSPSTDRVQYISTGSGTGIDAIASHDPGRFGDLDGVTAGIQATTWNNGDISNLASGVQYGLSETSLLQAQADAYANPLGGTIGNITLSPTPGAGQYPLPKPRYGALVQFPVALAPVALAYDPIYKKVDVAGSVTSYKLTVNAAFARTYGGLRLSTEAYCKIANGQITNWNDPIITALNGGTSLKDPADLAPFDAPIELVGRNDSSGTTQVTTRHFAAACNGIAGLTNNFTDANGTSTLPPAVQGPVVGGTPVVGKFTRAAGTPGVAAYASFSDVPATNTTLVRSRLAYLGADYTLPFSASNGLTYSLFTTDLQNSAGAYLPPTATAASAAFAANRPPQTAAGATGALQLGNTTWGTRANPASWVLVGGLANPTPAGAYPIVATVNFLGYTCYATSARANVVRSNGANTGILNYWFDDAQKVDGASGILASAGLAPLPTVWQNAITKTFLDPTSDAGSLNLFIDVAGGSANSACTSVTPGA